MATLTEVFTNIANAIRNKRKFNKSDKFIATSLSTAISKLDPYTLKMNITTVPNATIKATNVATNNIVTSTANSSGSATIDISIPSKWKILVTHGSYSYEKEYTPPIYTVSLTLKYGQILTINGVSPLTGDKKEATATTVGQYALFAGGWKTDNSGSFNTVDLYNTSLTKATTTPLSKDRILRPYGSTTIGNYALFVGGLTYPDTVNTVIDIYNKSCSKVNDANLTTAKDFVSCTTIGNYALLAGGNNYNTFYSTVEDINTSLSKSTCSYNLYSQCNNAASTSNSTYAIFAGGYYNNNLNIVTAYNSSLSRISCNTLAVARNFISAASFDNISLFIGGEIVAAKTGSNQIDKYSDTLTHSTSSYPIALGHISSVRLKDYIISAGGYYHSTQDNINYMYKNIVIYNKSLTVLGSDYGDTMLATYQSYLARTVLNNYALFGGGRILSNDNTHTPNMMNVYQFLT